MIGTHRFNSAGIVLDGDVRVWSEPGEGRQYVLGLDFAEGMETGDYDAGVLLDDMGGQCATVHGRWGNDGFYSVLCPLIDWYSPFIVGERQHGLLVLRRFFSEGRWLYYDRREDARSRPMGDKLGHAAVKLDPTVQSLRAELAPHGPAGELLPSKLVIRDERLLDELFRFQYRPRSSTVDPETAHDDQLVWGAQVGHHDDLVRAYALAVWGLNELPHYPQPKTKYAPWTWGAQFGIPGELAEERKPAGAFSQRGR